MIEVSQQQNKDTILKETEKFVRLELGDDKTGHDWWHIDRVVKMVEKIAPSVQADLFICKLAALLHDVADVKLNKTEELGLLKVRCWLEKQPLKMEEIEHTMQIISSMSYNAGENPPMKTIEGKVVQDADRLDAIGAIAIARTFLYAGHKGHTMYDPHLPPRGSISTIEYLHGQSTAINHFYEKLIKIKDLLNTDLAKSIAEERHSFMMNYLEQFHNEWNGIK